MAAKFDDGYIKDVERELSRNLEKAAIYLKTKLKEKLNITGNPYLASQGKGGRHYANETVSSPGEAPRKMLGNLQRSIAHAMGENKQVAYVGSALPYSLYLETGTTKMQARPFFRPTMIAEADTIARIIATGRR